MASVLFQDHPALPSGPWDEPLHWLGLVGDGIPAQVEQPLPVPPITLFENGGYAVLRSATSSWALFRLPNYRFRPAHADPLHFDLWHQGVNLLRDGGSYAYNASAADLSFFPGIASHNTVQFDGAEPMPRLGRFLWGDWCSWRTPGSGNSVTAAYRCPHGRHQRRIGLRVATMDYYRYLLGLPAPGNAALASVPWGVAIGGTSLIGPMATLQIHCDQPISRMELVPGWESRQGKTNSQCWR